MADTTGRTFICSVVFVDLVEYSKKSVAEQILLKETCNALIAEAIDAVPPDARIVLDTGDGAAITFLGDPEDALCVGLKLRDSIEEALTSHSIGIGRHKANGHIRVGVNLGPVKIATNVNGGANIVGDGIAVAERIMSFALPGQMLVSRSFFEMVSRLSDDYGSLFRHDGQRSDPNGRIHDLYLAGHDKTALQTAERGARERKKIASGDHVPLPKAAVARGGPASTHPGRLSAATAPPAPSATFPPKPSAPEAAAAISTGQMKAAPMDVAVPDEADPKRFLEDRYKVGFVATVLAVLALFQGFLVWQKKAGPTAETAVSVASTASTDSNSALPAAPPANPTAAAPAKGGEVDPANVKPLQSAAPAKSAPVEAATPRPVETPPPAKRSTDTPAVEKSAPKVSEPPAKKPVVEPAPTTPSKPAIAEKPAQSTPVSPPKPAPAAAARKSEAAQPPPASLQIPPTAPVQPSQVPVPAPAPQVIAPIEPPKPAPTNLITKVSGATVEFPAEAVRAGIASGYVRARVRIDANGVPAEVTIVESRPSRVFDRAVRNTLSLWRFNPGADNRIYEAQIDFNR
jgi:TonB family protein